MRSCFKIAAAAASFALSTLAAPSIAKSEIPISEYGQLPSVEDAVLSPSGKRIAVIATVQGERRLLVLEDQEKILSATPIRDMKIRGIEWIGDERLLLVDSQTIDLPFNFTTDKAEMYSARVLPMSANVKGGLIFGNRKNLINVIAGSYGTREIGGVLYGFFGALEMKRQGSRGYRFDHGRPYLYRVNFANFETKKIANAAAQGHDNDWLVDANGNVAVTLDINDGSGAWKLRGPDRKVIAEGKEEGGRVWLIGLGTDGSTVIYGKREGERTVWIELPLAGGEGKEFLPDADVERLFFDEQTGHLMGYIEDGASEKAVFTNPAYAKKANAVKNAFGKLEVRMVDWTSDLSQVIARTSGNKDSGTWFAVDLENNRANAIAYERNALGPDEVGAISTFEYEASDGLPMDGILTLPPGKEGKNLPVVVLPHGGPHSHDSANFDWWAQAFASRGYAVFQPNFRGSTNRTQAFRAAGFGEWGRKMQTDKSDGLAALAEAGIVDPSRACIVGASYGGYAALAGVTLQQGIYNCAVSVAGVSDIRAMYREDYRGSGNDRTTKISLRQQLGDPDTWDAVSPRRAAENADAPILLIHGKDDVVVPYSHSLKMADALKDAKKPYEFVALEGEDHWLSLSKTRQEMLEASIAFVEKHNPAD